MIEATSSNGAVLSSFHPLSGGRNLFQETSYPTGGVMQQYAQHVANHSNNAPNTAGVLSPRCVLPQISHGIANTSQSLAAAIFASSPLLGDNLKLAAAAASVAQSRGKKLHRAEPVPQSGFKGVSWNSRMKAWLAFYVTENGERKSKTFSTRKLGMEEARLQAISFCKQKQDQRREARKRYNKYSLKCLRNRLPQPLQECCSNDLLGGLINAGIEKLSSDESILGTPTSLQHSTEHHGTLRCGYPTTPGTTLTPSTVNTNGTTQISCNSEIAYVPIVPISVDMIEKSGLLQPLELTILPPCQHCNKQPYPFLMIVSEGQEQTYSGSSIMSSTSQTMSNTAQARNDDITTSNSPSNHSGVSVISTANSDGDPTSSENRHPENNQNPIYAFNV